MGLEGIGGTDRNGQFLDAVLTQVRNEDKASQSITAIRLNGGQGCPDIKGVRRGGRGLLPLNGAVTLLCPDAVVVDLGLEELAPSKVVTLDRS